MVAEHGGGSFLIGWAIFLFVWSLPLIMVEIFIGRRTRMGTMGSFGEFIGKQFAWFGPIITIVLAGITFYYSVVVGWTFKYFILALQGTFAEKIDSVKPVGKLHESSSRTCHLPFYCRFPLWTCRFYRDYKGN